MLPRGVGQSFAGLPPITIKATMRSFRIAAILLLVHMAVVAQTVQPRKRPAGPPLLVGFAAVELDPPAGVPLAGFGSGPRRIIPYVHGYDYATYFKPSTGTHDPVRAKAMVLKTPTKKLLFVSLDLAAVTTDMYEDLVARLEQRGWQRDEIVISATHTHSGPGALTHIWLWEFLAADRFHSKVHETVMGHILDAVQQAQASVQPAELFTTSFQAQGIQRNRRGHEGNFDPTANLLIARRTGKPEVLGALVNFALHGTSLNAHNLQLSGDNLAAIEGALAKRLSTGGVAPVMLFVNGAEGDVSPTRGGFDGIAQLAESFSEQAMPAVTRAKPLDPVWRTADAEVSLSGPRLTFGACLPRSAHRHLSDWFGVPLGHVLPPNAHIRVIAWGNKRQMFMLLWPGEPTTSLGLSLKTNGQQNGNDVWVLGLTNGYQGYFTTREEFAEGRYEACSDLYGDAAGEEIVQAFERLMTAASPAK
jgi:neutral/alkaline ceramidase-like enzyme